MEKVTTTSMEKATTSYTIDALCKSFDSILCDAKVPVSLKRFKAEAAEAWKRAHPEGIPKRSNAYTEFVKANMKTVRDENPSKPHAEHMKIMGQRWKEYKAQKILQSTSKSRKASQDEDSASIPVAKKYKKARRSVAPVNLPVQSVQSLQSLPAVLSECRVTRNSNNS